MKTWKVGAYVLKDLLWHHQDRLGKNDWHDARKTQAQRKERCAAGIDLLPDSTLRILDGNFSLGLVHRNRSRHHRHEERDQHDSIPKVALAARCKIGINQSLECGGQPREDANRDDE